MILPNKHLKSQDSVLGIGAVLMSQLAEPLTVTQLWERANKIPEIQSFEKFSLTLAFLFLIDAVEIRRGLLRVEGK